MIRHSRDGAIDRSVRHFTNPSNFNCWDMYEWNSSNTYGRNFWNMHASNGRLVDTDRRIENKIRRDVIVIRFGCTSELAKLGFGIFVA